jgi:hypothetical protein
MRPVSYDARGEIYELSDTPAHVNFITIKKGYARGGHSHDYKELFVVVRGCVEFIEPKETKFLLIGDSVVTKPNVPHMFYAESDSTVIEVRESGILFKAEPYEPMRSWVEWLRCSPRRPAPKCKKCGRFHRTKDHIYENRVGRRK